ncbi:hypothetical protein [Vannielia litorea]|uniref:Uncharacterized protein n=1 Tax=Vannielia litorea TaxID=1217970 RepID=A0A1N6F4P0_9RHOB|nr:hypothetical protein [Vannielia litorea]SIN90258.1 hypothetical protein SAMN05444002_1372 [Vannielia litorea]
MPDGATTGEQTLYFEYVDKGVSHAGSVNDFVLKPISASEAFRKYDWLRGAPVLNKSGNLRGMVINKNARVVYTISSKAADKIAVVSAVIEMAKEWDRAKTVYASNADNSEKFSRITLLFSASILRSVTSIVPTAVEIGALSLKGYGDLFSLVTGSSGGTQFGKAATDFARNVRTIHSRQWDGENWYNFIETVID